MLNVELLDTRNSDDTKTKRDTARWRNAWYMTGSDRFRITLRKVQRKAWGNIGDEMSSSLYVQLSLI